MRIAFQSSSKQNNLVQVFVIGFKGSTFKGSEVEYFRNPERRTLNL
jgi:hypothetical protein